MSQIAAELGLSLPLNLQHVWVRALAQVGGAACDFNSLRGKTGRFDGAIASTFANPLISISFGGAPFFGGTLNGASQNISNGNLQITSLSAPNWTGNVKLINNTTAVSAVLPFAGSGTWSLSGASSVLRAANTDGFTLLPST
jgi:hypothetical protein